MLQYTNGFSCAIDPTREEVIINYTQQAPIFDEDGNVTKVKVEEVIGLAMGRGMAENLVEALNGLLNDSDR